MAASCPGARLTQEPRARAGVGGAGLGFGKALAIGREATSQGGPSGAAAGHPSRHTENCTKGNSEHKW